MIPIPFAPVTIDDTFLYTLMGLTVVLLVVGFFLIQFIMGRFAGPAAMFFGGSESERYPSAVTKLSITSLRPARSKSTVSFWPSTPTTLPGPNLR